MLEIWKSFRVLVSGWWFLFVIELPGGRGRRIAVRSCTVGSTFGVLSELGLKRETLSQKTITTRTVYYKLSQSGMDFYH